MTVTVFASDTVTLIYQFYTLGVEAKLSEFVRKQCYNGKKNCWFF